MDVVTTNYLPGDPRLIDQIVYELKSQGIFDQFRKECIADVDTKPAYQNLSQRVEGSVMNFLMKQKFSEDMNKNQLREQLRKNISESGFLETGVERIVDQVVNPKINTIFLPKVEDVVYRFLGLEKPNEKPSTEVKEEDNANVGDLLPNDLEAISPESVHADNSFNSNTEKKDDSIETNENSLNSSNTKTEDESPPFELLEENTKFSVHEENSVDSHLSGISGLASHDSVNSTEMKDVNQIDVSQENSQNSLNSEGNLSIVTSEGETNMEICEDSDYSDNKEVKKESNSNKVNEEYQIKENEVNLSGLNNKETASEKYEEKTEEIKNEVKTENKKEVEDKKPNEHKDDSKKNNDKHKSSRSNKDRKDEKDKRSRSKSESKSKDHRESKSSSKHSSSSSKDRDKDKKEHKNGKDKEENSEKDKQVKKEEKDRDRNKEKISKSKEKLKNEKDKSDKDKTSKDKDRPDKDKTTKDKDRPDKDKNKSDKEKISKDKSGKDKEKPDKEKSRSEKEKSKSDRERDKVDKDKPDKDKSERDRSSSSKHGKEKSSSSKTSSGSSKDKGKNDEKPKDKNSSSKDKTSSGSKHKESSSKEKDSSKSSKDKDKLKPSSSSSKDKDKKGGDSKSKSSEKHKKSDKDKSSHNEKNSSSSKKDKERKVIDDHYSLKDKRGERRSTDRDSNDGSSKMSRNGSFTESYSQSYKGSSKASSEVFSSGSGDSSNSDKMEEEPTAYSVNGVDELHMEAPQIIKYIKPKFASNIHEAMKIMKIRKQLAKLERQNQLSLSNVQMIKDDQVEPKAEPEVESNLKELSVVLEKSTEKFYLSNNKLNAKNNKENIKTAVENKCNEQRIVLSDEQHTKGQEVETSVIDGNKKVEKEATKENKQNSKELIVEEPPIFKSHDLSMENFEALEARLAQEMAKVNYHMYGEEDDTYEYPSISLSPVKKRKASVEESKPPLKKILFESSNANTEKDEEVELVVNKQYTVFIGETGAINNDVNIPTSNSQLLAENLCEEAVVTEEIDILNENTNILSKENGNIIIDNEGELVIDETQEEYVDYIQETIINDIIDSEYDNILVENKNEGLEHFIKCPQDTVLLQNDFETCNQDIESVKLDVSHHKDEGHKNIEMEFSYDNNDEFRGFDVIDKDDSKTIQFTEKISDMEKAVDRFTNIINLYVTKKNISGIPKMRNAKTASPRKEDKTMLKRDLALETTIKEMTNMSSTIQDLLQKNGKKLFIKMDKLDSKSPSKVVVSFQGLDSKENVCKINYEEEMKTREEIQRKIRVCIGAESKKVQIYREQSSINTVILSPKSNNKGRMPANDLKEINAKWEEDDSPCYYFDKNNVKNEKHLKILTDMIGRLEKAVEKRSLQIQNNIPTVKKRGRKRKVQNTDNNVILNDPNPEPKKRKLSDDVSKQNGENLCSNSLTLILDVTHNQSFNLPLSPAESEKSDEHKKEELITVKPKRSGRVSNNKRYSSEDLYKPRPVLSCSSRRRGIKPEDRKP